MIKREFWENIASVWGKKEKIEFEGFIDELPIDEEDLIDLNEVEDWDDLLKDLLSPDSEEIDLADILSD